MLGLMILFMWVGFLVGGQTGMIMAFVLAAAMNFFSYWYSAKMVLKMYKARAVTETDHPRLFRTVRRVATQAMIPVPKVYIVPNKAPNAFATGRNIENAAVAVTQGLLEPLNDAELEGVLGHDIAHIMNNDMLLRTIAATFPGPVRLRPSFAQSGAVFGGFGRGSNRGGGLGLLVAAIVAPIAAMLIQMAISRQREFKADRIGGKITAKPLALASALKKLHSAPIRLNLDQKPATAHLMIANPLSGKGIASLFSTHPPVEKRIALLEKQAYQSDYTPVS